ncbi:MAG: DNA methyltransferase [Planctomycetota bacterium]
MKQLQVEDALDGVGFSTDDIHDALVQQLKEQEEVDKQRSTTMARTADLRSSRSRGRETSRCSAITSCSAGIRPNSSTCAASCGGRQGCARSDGSAVLVDYTGERPNDSGKDWTGTCREIDIKDADGFFRSVFANVLEVLGEERRLLLARAQALRGHQGSGANSYGLLDHQQIIWVKPTSVFGHVYWHFQHEPCMMGWRKGDKPDHDGLHEYTSVWTVDWDGKAKFACDHPTSKPVELFVRPIKKHTKLGDIVFEPFSGSGSQIIGAERTGRRCRAIEISPGFVDVAIKRWERATGRLASLGEDGRTLAEVAVERGRS